MMLPDGCRIRVFDAPAPFAEQAQIPWSWKNAKCSGCRIYDEVKEKQKP
jgi:hypothetical protein